VTKFARQPIEALVAGVKDFALSNYENGWCDLVVETQSDEELAAIIREGKANTVRVAILRTKSHFAAFAEQRRCVQNEAF
jgi:hypothetical protein